MSVTKLSDELTSLQCCLQESYDAKLAVESELAQTLSEQLAQRATIQSLAADVSELELSREGGLKVIHSAPQRVQLQCTAGEGEERD